MICSFLHVLLQGYRCAATYRVLLIYCHVVIGIQEGPCNCDTFLSITEIGHCTFMLKSMYRLSRQQDRLSIGERIKFDEPDSLCRLLRVDKAYHSPQMQDAAEEYEASLQGLPRGSSPIIPLFSTVTGTRITDQSQLDGKYWRQNLVSPVLFMTATNAILDSEKEPNQVFLEIGPHSALSGPLRQILSEHRHRESCSYVPSLVQGEDPKTSVLYTAGSLYTAGASLKFHTINSEGNLLVDLPPYPWQHNTRYWS